MGTEQPGLAALKREWLMGLAFVAGGFVIAIAVAAYLTFGRVSSAPVPMQTPTAEGVATEQQAAEAGPEQVCRTALANAQNFGIIPSFGKLTDETPRATDKQGRYLCSAATPSTSYTLSVDLVCEQLAKPECVNIYAIVQDDGTELYKRQE